MGIFDNYSIKVCKAFLNYFLGSYLDDPLNDDQISFRDGCAICEDINLNLSEIKKLLSQQNVPFEVNVARISKITCQFPWSTKDNTTSFFEFKGLELELSPISRSNNMSPDSMLDSMFSSMTSSPQSMEDSVMASIITPQEPYDKDTVDGLAKWIDNIIANISLTLKDVTVRLDYAAPGATHCQGLILHIRRIDISKGTVHTYDEPITERIHRKDSSCSRDGDSLSSQTSTLRGSVSSHDERSTVCGSSTQHTPGASSSKSHTITGEVAGTVCKELKVTDVSIFWDIGSVRNKDLSESLIESNMPLDSADWRTESTNQEKAIQIALLSGEQFARVTLRADASPRLQLDLSLKPLHIFLAPDQLHSLILFAEGLTGQNGAQGDEGQSSFPGPGQTSTAYLTQSGVETWGESGPYAGVRIQVNPSSGESMLFHSCQSVVQESQERGYVPDGSEYTSFTDMTLGPGTNEPSVVGQEHFNLDEIKRGYHSNRFSKLRQSVEEVELARFHLSVELVSIVLLHEPLHASPGSELDPGISALEKLRQASDHHFGSVRGLDVDGGAIVRTPGDEARLLEHVRMQLSDICRKNHLSFLARMSSLDLIQRSCATKERSTAQISVQSMELVETLFDNLKARGFSLPDDPTPKFAVMVSFPDRSKLDTPSLKASFETTSEHSTTGSASARVYQRRSLHLELAECLVEVDISLTDRLRALLGGREVLEPGLVGQLPYECGSAPLDVEGHQLGFMGDQPDGSGTLGSGGFAGECVTTLIATSPRLFLRLRFPIPDLRTGGGVGGNSRLLWWRRNLRAESLTVELTELGLNCKLSSGDDVVSVEVNPSDIHVMLETPDAGSPYSILRACGDDSNNFDKMPSIVVRRQKSGAELVQESPVDDSLRSFIDMPVPQPNFRRPLVTQRTHSEGASQFQKHHQQVTHSPAETEDLAKYRSEATIHSRLVVDVNLPNVQLNLQNKKVLDLVYERVCCDLVLWESLAPSEDPRVCDSRGEPLNIYGLPEAVRIQPSGSMGGPGDAQYQDFDSDPEEESMCAPQTGPDTRATRMHEGRITQAGQSHLCLQLKIGKGRVRAMLPAKEAGDTEETERCGELALDLNNACIFLECAHDGHPEVTYLMVQAQTLQVHHIGISDTKSFTSLRDYFNLTEPLPHLLPLIVPAPLALQHAFNNGLGREEMLAVAMEFKEKRRETRVTRKVTGLPGQGNCPTQQDIIIAVRVRQAALRYRVQSSAQSWYSQLSAMFDLRDPAIAGYTPPDSVSVTHLHLEKVAVDYSPPSLPLRGMITCEKFTMTSNVLHAEEANYVLQIFLGETALFLAQGHTPQATSDWLGRDIRANWVCIAEMGSFELSVAYGQSRYRAGESRVDVRLTNNCLSVHTCVDSLAALCRLLEHLATAISETDESPPPSPTPGPSSVVQESMSSGPSGLESMGKREQPSVHRLSETEKRELKDMLADAISNTDTGSLRRKGSDDDYVIVDDASIPAVEDIVEALEPPPERDEGIQVRKGHYCPPRLRKKTHFTDPARYPEATLAVTLYDASIALRVFGGNDFPEYERDLTKRTKSDTNLPRTRPISIDVTSTSRSSSNSRVSDSAPSSLASRRSEGVRIQTGASGAVRFTKKPSASLSAQSTLKRANEAAREGHGVINETNKLKWWRQGGRGRKTDESMELQLTKITYRVAYFPETSEFASRHLLTIRQVEIVDKVRSSRVNKFLYLYADDSIPFNDKAPMVLFKMLTNHADLDVGQNNLESEIKVSIQPLRLHIDQDALDFLSEFYRMLMEEWSERSAPPSRPSSRTSSTSDQPILSVRPPAPPAGQSHPTQLAFDEASVGAVGGEIGAEGVSPMTGRASGPMFIRKFTFTPDVHIKLDYYGKRIDISQGALMGTLSGLTQLSNSVIVVRRLEYERGFCGVDRLLRTVLEDWGQDMPSHMRGILGGLGPMHECIQIVSGIRDLVFLPVAQYREDGGVLRGIKQGARSFTASTLWAALELSARGVKIVQAVAETTYDLVTPGPSLRSRQPILRQPADLREGMSNAMLAVHRGFSTVASDLTHAAQRTDKGLAGTVGEVLRQFPPTMVAPIVVASEATYNVLGGLRNQVRPQAKKEDEQKWKDTSGL